MVDSVRNYLLAFADDEHLMGQQHTEWIGVAPFLEEDLAFASIGQDELGHAALLYELILGAEQWAAADPDIDELAFGRASDEYRSCHFVEFTTTDWIEAFVRHWMYDVAEDLRWSLLSDSSNERLRLVAATAAREEIYHRRHAESLLVPLLASDESAVRVRAAVAHLAGRALGMFEAPAGEAEVVDAGVASAPLSSLVASFKAAVEDTVGPVSWSETAEPGQRTVRSAAFAPLLERMREVIELDPTATW